MQNRPTYQTIYIHSASKYAVLLIGGALSSKNTTIIIAHDYPQKNILRICFSLNNLRELYFEEEIYSKINIERADFVITESIDYADRYKEKPVILVLSNSVSNPKKSSFYRLNQEHSCSEI